MPWFLRLIQFCSSRLSLCLPLAVLRAENETHIWRGVPEKKKSLTALPLTLFGLGNKVCENDTAGFLDLFSLKIFHILYAPSADEVCL